MGRMTAIGLAQSGADLDTALAMHLQGNHYPPIHLAFVPVAKQAVVFARMGDWDLELTYPNDLVRTVAETIEGLHLEPFLDSEHTHWYDETGVPGYTECECGAGRKYNPETQSYENV